MLTTRSSSVEPDTQPSPDDLELAPVVERQSYRDLPPWSTCVEDSSVKQPPKLARRSASKAAPSFDLVPGARRAGPPLLTAFLWIGAAGGLFYASWRRDVMLGQLAAAAIGLGGLQGLWRGGLCKVVMLPLFVAVAYAVARLPASLGMPGVTGYLVAGVAGMVALFIGATTVSRVRRSAVESRPMLHRLERCIGVWIGAAEGALIPLALCWAAVAIRPAAARISATNDTRITQNQRATADAILRIANEVNSTGLADLVGRTSPMERIPALRDAINQFNRDGQIKLDDLSPETKARLEELLKLIPSGEGFEALNQSQSSAEQRQEAYENLRKQIQSGR